MILSFVVHSRHGELNQSITLFQTNDPDLNQVLDNQMMKRKEKKKKRKEKREEKKKKKKKDFLFLF